MISNNGNISKNMYLKTKNMRHNLNIVNNKLKNANRIPSNRLSYESLCFGSLTVQ